MIQEKNYFTKYYHYNLNFVLTCTCLVLFRTLSQTHGDKKGIINGQAPRDDMTIFFNLYLYQSYIQSLSLNL